MSTFLELVSFADIRARVVSNNNNPSVVVANFPQLAQAHSLDCIDYRRQSIVRSIASFLATSAEFGVDDGKATVGMTATELQMRLNPHHNKHVSPNSFLVNGMCYITLKKKKCNIGDRITHLCKLSLSLS